MNHLIFLESLSTHIDVHSYVHYLNLFVRAEPFLCSSQDISARSPMPDAFTPRQSLDSRRSTYQSRASFDRRVDRPEPTEEEDFEDVGLNDEVKPSQQQKKRSFFTRFNNDSNNNTSATDKSANAAESRPNSSHHGFHFTGRKRGQSGKGEELRSMGKTGMPKSDAQGITA
jgi:hypothetical protein